MLCRVVAVHAMLVVRVTLDVKYMPLDNASVSRFSFP